MNKKLYAMMDWAKIEELVYGECDHPDAFLGAHTRGRQTLIQAFFPGAANVSIYLEGAEGAKGRTVKEEIPMEMADEAGFFAALLPGTAKKEYYYHVEYPLPEEEGSKKKKKNTRSVDRRELYGFGRILSDEEELRFSTGTEIYAYRYMGAHKAEVRNIRGCIFRVWAPDAVRVSLVGDFNEWNDMLCPMNRLDECGIFELFVPGVEEGACYSYDVLMKGGSHIRKADPYSVKQAADDPAVSVVSLLSYRWKDDKWLSARKKYNPAKQPFNLYTLSLDKLPDSFLKDKKAMNELADYITSMGYSHVEFLPIAQSGPDGHTALFLAADTCHGEAENYMNFIDILHAKNIGVILRWQPADLSNVDYGPGSFDGSPLYEYADPRRGIDPRTGMLKFDLGRSQVLTYLFSVLNFWTEVYHADGFVTPGLASMLYLDYYRQPGEWVPNIYGGVEHLEAIAFLREMNTMLHKNKSGLISIAMDAACFPKVSETSDEGLGFDLVSDADCVNELIDYLSRDPIVRRSYHHALTGSMVYQYCEHYLLPVGINNINYRQGGLRMRMYGGPAEQWKGLKLLYGYLTLHTGRCAMISGQEYGETASYEDMPSHMPDEKKELESEVFRAFVRSLNQFYAGESALYACDDEEASFVWLKEDGAEDNVIAFIRRDSKKSYVCIFNFANVERDKYFIGVEKEGKYKEVFSSDAGGCVDGPSTAARKQKTDGREYRIRTHLPALGFKIYRYIPFTAEEKAEIRRREEERTRKRLEEEALRTSLKEERSRLRREMKAELAEKIKAAETAIIAASEEKRKKKK